MSRKCLMTASSLAHLRHFHQPYIKALQDTGWEVHIAGTGESHPSDIADETIPLTFEKSFASLTNFHTAAQLRRLIRKNKYELIICHTSLAAFFTRMAAIGIKSGKLINVVHGYLFDDATPRLKAAVLKTAEYLMRPVTDKVLTMNVWDYEWAQKHRLAPVIRFIPGMGLDGEKVAVTQKERVCGLNEDDFVLVYAAEFSKRKNQAMLIRVMRHLPAKVKLILAGDGDALGECKALADSYGLTGRVFFPGYMSDVSALLGSADAAVSSSRSEGLPFNILEAMTAGLPVIVSDVKGNQDLVHDGVNGFVYPYDDEQVFISCAERLMDAPLLCATMGEQGRTMAEQYSLEQVLPIVMNEYSSDFD